MPSAFHSPAIILPAVSPSGGPPGFTNFLMVADVIEHTSLEVPTEFLQEKVVEIMAQEVATAPAAVPGPLWCWIELSPIPTVSSTQWPLPLPASAAYWGAIGGGGGALPPTAPLIEVSGLGGAAGALIHSIKLPWNVHSRWARVVVQTPVAAALPNAYWVVQAIFTAKSL